MNIILSFGGSGKRLRPLSNDAHSKQFIKIFRGEEGGYESMVQRIYRQIKRVDAKATVTITTSGSQVSTIHNQSEGSVGTSVEPCRCDTFPAVTLTTSYLHDVQGVNEEETVVACPVDPCVDNSYFEALRQSADQAQKGEANLVLMGIESTCPSGKYGYITPIDEDRTSTVSMFREKPDAETAKEYITQGTLWNGGVFAYKLGYAPKITHERIDFTDHDDLLSKYDTLDEISSDYAIVEKENKIQVQRFTGQRKDLGTWNTLIGAMADSVVGNAMLNDICESVHAVNELDVPAVCMRLKDIVVSAPPEGILVSDKEQSSYIKPFADQISQQIMFAEKSWGNYRVLDVEAGSLTIKVILDPGHRMNYHSHARRDEAWNIIPGEGSVTVDGKEWPVKAGDVVSMQADCRHTTIARTEVEAIEIQMGMEINVYDRQKFELEGLTRSEGVAHGSRKNHGIILKVV